MNALHRIGRLLRSLAYPAFFSGCFLFFCYQTFPYHRLRDFLVQQVENPMRPGGRRAPSGYELEIGDLAPYWVSGVELTSVRLRKLPEAPTERRVAVAFPTIKLRVAILPLLIGQLRAHLSLATNTGDVDANVGLGFDGSLRAVDARLSGINLRHFQQAGLGGKVPLTGSLSGTVDIELPESGANGLLDLNVRNLSLGDGETRVPVPGTVLAGGLTLETIRAGTLQLRARFANGTARVERLNCRGTDIQLRGVGNILLDRDPRLARLDLFLSAKFGDEYQARNDRTRSMFQLMDMNARLRQARTTDGSWQFHLRGSPAGQLIPEPAGRERFPAQ